MIDIAWDDRRACMHIWTRFIQDGKDSQSSEQIGTIIMLLSSI